MILDLPWSQAGKNEGVRLAIREGLPLSSKGVRPENWFSLVNHLDYYSDHWVAAYYMSENEVASSSEGGASYA